MEFQSVTSDTIIAASGHGAVEPDRHAPHQFSRSQRISKYQVSPHLSSVSLATPRQAKSLLPNRSLSTGALDL